MKKLLAYTISGIILFIIAYMVTGILAHSIIGDKIYGESVTVSAEVEGLQVKELPYSTNEPLQPAYNITKL